MQNKIAEIFSDSSVSNNMVVNYLLSDLSKLKGIGEKLYPKLIKLIEGKKVIDLLYHFPTSVIDRTYRPLLKDAKIGRIVTVTVIVQEHISSYHRSQPHKVICTDGTDSLTINFFNIDPRFIRNLMKVGSNKIISSKLDFWSGGLSMSNPEIISDESDADKIPNFESVYPLTNGISNNYIRKLILQILESLKSLNKIEKIPEWLDKLFKQHEHMPDWLSSVENMHTPKSNECFDVKNIYRKRIAYDEILSSQMALGLIRNAEKSTGGLSIKGDGNCRNQLTDSLNFQLTTSQNKVLDEIYSDMGSDKRMIRLIQGDVGSGKTIVSLMAILNAIECGYNCALMAPTEILSTQHFENISEILLKASLQDIIKVELLTGKDKRLKKKEKIQLLESGKINIIIGTHALFQDNINIPNLGLIVIDEQHRFGVKQRLMLTNKGINADVLSMTATPIPRTLAMTTWGDMDISIIDELPKGRIPIETKIASIKNFDSIINLIRNCISKDEKVYWVCPLVEESLKKDLVAVESRFKDLQKYFADKVEMVHGRMKSDEKIVKMSRFSAVNGPADILIATTVIEVGVNVPSATLMIIEHCEVFGLSALHQLRGRIGRSDKPSICILLHGDKLTDTAKQRIKIMKDTNDGFVIAEEDLKIRGAGDILGIKQSGVTEFKIADYEYDKDLFITAKNDVKYILNQDENLNNERGKSIKILLNIFKKENDIYNIYSG